jgi:hypothetical protein
MAESLSIYWRGRLANHVNKIDRITVLVWLAEFAMVRVPVHVPRWVMDGIVPLLIRNWRHPPLRGDRKINPYIQGYGPEQCLFPEGTGRQSLQAMGRAQQLVQEGGGRDSAGPPCGTGPSWKKKATTSNEHNRASCNGSGHAR